MSTAPPVLSTSLGYKLNTLTMFETGKCGRRLNTICVRSSLLRKQVLRRQLLALGNHPLIFAAIAREVSGNRATAIGGGDLGWLFPGQLAPEIHNALQAKSGSGLLDHAVHVGSAWLVLEILDERQVPVPTLPEVHNFLEAKLLWRDVTGLF